jgi:hypothetical protein
MRTVIIGVTRRTEGRGPARVENDVSIWLAFFR